MHDGSFFQFRVNGFIGHYKFSYPLLKNEATTTLTQRAGHRPLLFERSNHEYA